jgi:hypothetical protein
MNQCKSGMNQSSWNNMQHKCGKGIFAVLKKGADYHDYQLKMQAKIRHIPWNTLLRAKENNEKPIRQKWTLKE